MKIQTNSKTSSIQRIVELIHQGVESWIEAGKIVAKEIDSDPDFIDKICAEVPGISHEIVLRLDQIGRNRLYPHLLLNDSPGVRKLYRLPRDLQEKFWSEPVELLISDGDKTETLKVDVRNLSPAQARQVFNGATVRSVAAQRAWLEDEKARNFTAAVEVDDSYRVVGRRVVFRKNVSLTAKELARILAEIE